MSTWQSINTRPCQAVPACIIAYRTVYAQLQNTGNTLAGSDNMIAWLNSFDITTVNWGCTTYAVFENPGDTTPTGGITPNYEDGGHPYSRTDFWYSPADLIVSPNSDAAWSQVLLGAAAGYMVLAVGFTTGADSALISVEGCAAPLPANPACVGSAIINLPIPDAALGYNCQEYLFALAGPNPTGGAIGQYPDLATFASIVCPNYGASWNPAQLCGAPANDPLTNQ